MPELLARPDPIEAKVQEIFNRYEVAKSRLSSHELQHIQDLKIKEDPNSEVIIKETAQDREDRWIREMSEFKFAPHDERLTYTQYLFVKQKFGTDMKDQWLLPQASYDHQQDANLLQTARRALKEMLDLVNGYVVIGKVPSSHYSFRYPRKIAQTTGFVGAKVFFMKANLDNNANKLALKSLDKDRFRWLTEAEAQETVHKRYMNSFSRGLLSEKRLSPADLSNLERKLWASVSQPLM